MCLRSGPSNPRSLVVQYSMNDKNLHSFCYRTSELYLNAHYFQYAFNGDSCLVGYDDVSVVKELLTFQIRMLPPYSGSRLRPEDGSSKLLYVYVYYLPINTLP
jgi:hypothetical protein